MNKNYNKWFLSKVKQAIKTYKLIEDNDEIAVGLSGGKDSLALTYILWHLQHFSHLNFNLSAIHIDMGWNSNGTKLLESFCQEKNIPIIIEKTSIGQAILQNGKLIPNPCSLCSRLKRGALVNIAEKNGIKKIALGHHADDATETLLLNLLFGGTFKVFPPRIDYQDRKISIIRPLLYLEEKTLLSLAMLEKLPIQNSLCPADGLTCREKIKNIVTSIKKDFPQLNANIINALENLSAQNFWNR